jgi:hypothetical protein
MISQKTTKVIAILIIILMVLSTVTAFIGTAFTL